MSAHITAPSESFRNSARKL